MGLPSSRESRPRSPQSVALGVRCGRNLNTIITIVIAKMFDLVNRHVLKILLAVEDGDSINRISQKAGSSYAWTHKWVKRLVDTGVVERDDGVRIVDRPVADAFEAVAQFVLQRGLALEDAYLLPNFAGQTYAFTRTDAVYVWTHGGYQIGRNRNDYPIFIEVLAADLESWQEFFAAFGVPTRVWDRGGDGIYFVLFPQDRIEAEWTDNAAVIPLAETIEWMEQYAVNFQPALEMLEELYDLDLGYEYRERGLA